MSSLHEIQASVEAAALEPVDGSGLPLATYWADLVGRIPVEVQEELAHALPNALLPLQMTLERWHAGELDPDQAMERALTGMARLWALSRECRDQHRQGAVTGPVGPLTSPRSDPATSST
jgi:hypothetical protein